MQARTPIGSRQCGLYVMSQQTTPEEILDGLVRDACSVVPVNKSEYRRRLLAWHQQDLELSRVEARIDELGHLKYPSHTAWLQKKNDFRFKPIGVDKRLVQLQQQRKQILDGGEEL
jgi:hypothetical protein